MKTKKGLECLCCHDRIFSFYRHDFKHCKCGKIAVDGGNDYLRIVGNKEDFKVVSESLKERINGLIAYIKKAKEKDYPIYIDKLMIKFQLSDSTVSAYIDKIWPELFKFCK